MAIMAGPAPHTINAGLIHRILREGARTFDGCLLARNKEGRIKVGQRLLHTQRVIGLWFGCPETEQVTSTCGDRRCIEPTHIIPRTPNGRDHKPVPRAVPSDYEKFFCRVRRSAGCWTWIGKKETTGYGSYHAEGRRWGAHRYCFKLINKYLPPVVRHTCDNRICVNPDHLIAGTHLDNAFDREIRERSWYHKIVRGERPPVIKQIRCAYRCHYCDSITLRRKNDQVAIRSIRLFCGRTCRTAWQRQVGNDSPWLDFTKAGLTKKGAPMRPIIKDDKGVFRRTLAQVEPKTSSPN